MGSVFISRAVGASQLFLPLAHFSHTPTPARAASRPPRPLQAKQPQSAAPAKGYHSVLLHERMSGAGCSPRDVFHNNLYRNTRFSLCKHRIVWFKLNNRSVPLSVSPHACRLPIRKELALTARSRHIYTLLHYRVLRIISLHCPYCWIQFTALPPEYCRHLDQVITC